MMGIAKRMAPKVINPRVHSLLDVLTVGTFLVMGAVWWRRKRRPALAALANGLFVAGYAALTDFDGDGKRPLTFKAHGQLDGVQAAMAEAAPKFFGFSDDTASLLFRGQAVNEALVIALTDFEANERRSRRRLEPVA